MGKVMKRNLILIIAIMAMLLAFAVVAKAEIINPTAKSGIVFDGLSHELVEPGQLTDGDENGRHFRYKFESDDDSGFVDDYRLIAGKDAGQYNIEWQLVSTRDGGESVLDAGKFSTTIAATTTTEKRDIPNTGIEDNKKTVLGISAFCFAAVILALAYVIREKSEKN